VPGRSAFGGALRGLGGSGPGALVVRAFPFAFDSPGLATGLELFTPAPGDVLYDAWPQIDVAWDGTTPTLDVGNVAPFSSTGLYGQILVLPGASVQDFVSFPTLVGGGASLDFATPPAPTLSLQAYTAAAAARAIATDGAADRIVPSLFTTAHPVAVWVTQTGVRGDADPGSTQGSGVLYVVTATPA
jgi:hypothetical protein